MRRLLSVIMVAGAFGLAGCHTCDVCDDCGDGYGCGGNGYHARHYGDPGFAPGYVVPGEAPILNTKTSPKPTRVPATKSQQTAKTKTPSMMYR